MAMRYVLVDELFGCERFFINNLSKPAKIYSDFNELFNLINLTQRLRQSYRSNKRQQARD